MPHPVYICLYQCPVSWSHTTTENWESPHGQFGIVKPDSSATVSALLSPRDDSFQMSDTRSMDFGLAGFVQVVCQLRPCHSPTSIAQFSACFCVPLCLRPWDLIKHSSYFRERAWHELVRACDALNKWSVHLRWSSDTLLHLELHFVVAAIVCVCALCVPYTQLDTMPLWQGKNCLFPCNSWTSCLFSHSHTLEVHASDSPHSRNHAIETIHILLMFSDAKNLANVNIYWVGAGQMTLSHSPSYSGNLLKLTTHWSLVADV